MSDLISRQAIMKEFADFVRKSNNSDFAQTPTWNDAVSLIGSMPSAQPEIDFDEWCVDCKEYDHDKHCCPRFNKVIRNTLNDLQTTQPERKKGKWIDKSGGIEGAWNYCSVCGEQAIDLYDYCPNCGAMMKEGDEHEREGRND